MASSVINNKTPFLREINISYTINANSTYNTNLKNLIDNNMPNGYRFAGLCGYASNNIQVLTTNFAYYNSDYSLQLANRSNAAIGSTTYRIFYLAMPQ